MKENQNKNTPPCQRPAPTPEELTRRRFLERLSLVAGGVGALILTVPIAGFILAPFFARRHEMWRSVGKVESFKIGETAAVQYEDATPLPWAGVTARSAAWLRRESADTFIAFSINCTHLGCPVRWLAEANLFMCPCHGGVYYKDGAVAAGPPPSPLPRYPVRVKDGDVQIQTASIPISNK
jgi:menaquinol-cytochrome c reductase iron-sulfur subunit